MKAVRKIDGRSGRNRPALASKPGSQQQEVPRKTITPPVTPPTTIELRGISIHFPFKPYECQEDYMGKVLDALLRSENALLESPTGTGKTLCLLCSALAWQREQAKTLKSSGTFDTTARAGLEQSASQQQRKRRVPTIIYASRTHSQLSQVVRELRNTRYRPKHAVLGSREQMCVNPKVKKPDGSSTSTAINHDCSCLTKEQRCKFKNKLEGFKAPSNESSSQSAWHGTQPVMDMEDLVTMGKTHNVCPFYYTRGQVEDAELVLVPYNYLFDKDSRTTTLADIPWDNAVLIFDEAHNLESFASESASFDFSSKDIAGCMSEIDKALNLNESYPERFTTINNPNLLRLKALFLRLEEHLLKKLPQQATSYQGQRIMDIFQQGANITYDNHTLVLGELKKIFDVFLEVRGGNSKGAPKLELFSQCLKRVFGESSLERCLAKAQSYRVHLTQAAPATSLSKSSSSSRGKYHDGGDGGRTLSYWCFAPSEAMRELANLNVRSILVTSGTLSPLESYALELDLPFPNRLENPHIITPHQIHVRVMGRGVSNKELTSSYERRQNNDYYIELGNTLASLSCVIPCGMLVFFPSYGVMETSIERWGGPTSSRSSSNNKNPSNFFTAKKSRNGAGSGNTNRYSFPSIATNSRYSGSEQTHSTPWKRLLSQKAVVIEPRSSTDLPDAIADFHRFLNLPKSKGVALFGVCRGKISEGIDFSHDMCRAVIITGLPFAPTFDPKVKMKREFLDQKKAKQNVKASTSGGFGTRDGSDKNCSLSGHAWYTQQAHRAVNQAIGRVIRNKRDYGSVILMDSRFGLPGNQNGLSKWVRPHILPDEGFGRANQKLAQFYKKAKEHAEKEAEIMIASTSVAPKPTNVSLILKYEDEENLNNRIDTIANEDKITKVAFIKDHPVQKERKDQIQNDVHENYVDPQRVIARVDMDELSRQQQQSSLVVPSAKYSQQAQPKPNVIKPKNPTTSPALRFFQLVQSTMTKDEFDSIKKNIGLMKKYTDLKFRKEFIGSVRSILEIILHHEPIYGRSRKQKPELLGLLLQLLPKHFLNDVQQTTVDLVFRSSTIRKELKPALASNEYMKLHMEFVKFLHEVWFQENIDKNSRQVVQRLETLLSRIVTSHRITKSALSQFVDIVPFEIRRLTMALIEEMKASIAVSKIRAEENSRIKEAVVKSEYFRKNYHARNQKLNKDEEESNDKNIQPFPIGESENQSNRSKEMQSKVHSHSNLQGFSKKMTTMKNPYAKSIGKTRTLSDIRQSVSASSSCNVVGKKSSLSAILDKKKRNLELSNGSATSSSSSLEKILHQSESDTFAGSMKKMRRTNFSSNAPKNIICTICDLPLDKLYISECGHMACLQCVS
jgi:regulator of telomere elongation helicase 1